MPDDIYDDYVQMIKTGLKKKKEQYVKEYNILHSQKTTVKFKHRSINLYSVATGYKSKYDDQRGLLTVNIDPRM
jgi:ubiquinone/menaquinone biosynthesis C-methylase UbiE